MKKSFWLSEIFAPGGRGKTAVYLLLAIAAAIFLSCAGALQPQRPVLSPIVRIGIVLNAEEIEFKPETKMTITPKRQGDKYRSSQTDLWKVRVDKASLTGPQYRMVLGEFGKKADAKKAAKEFEDKQVKTEVVQEGDELWFGGKLISGAPIFRVYATATYDTKDLAEAAKKTNSALGEARLVPAGGPLTGNILLISPKGDVLPIKDAVRLSGTSITINNVLVGEGYHWSRQEKRAYTGELEFRINNDGNLVAINVLPLEEYLVGVLPGEMISTFPMEALKAQAIAARTFFLYNFNRVHINDPYDVCADVHCQVYVGTARRDDKIDKAVRETRGLVLQHNDRLCTTPFFAVCGGHTEHSENVWNGDPQPYLAGVFDLAKPEQVQARFDLSQETNARRWIESMPDVFCNVEKNGTPTYAAYAKKYFRWEVRLTRQDLAQNIRTYTGQDFGELLDLQAASRGSSGRIVEMRVIGSTDTLAIGKELRIRKALSPTTLYSACIVFDKIGAEDGLPDEFVIKGAGWGHGVGMCQIGAALMAEKGLNADDILRHYYAGAKIRQMY